METITNVKFVKERLKPKNIKVTLAFTIKLALFYGLRALVHFDWLILITCWEIVMISQTIKHGNGIAVINIIGKSQSETLTLCWDSKENDNIPAADSHKDLTILQRTYHSSSYKNHYRCLFNQQSPINWAKFTEASKL